jgi:hypothetical protein
MRNTVLRRKITMSSFVDSFSDLEETQLDATSGSYDELEEDTSTNESDDEDDDDA